MTLPLGHKCLNAEALSYHAGERPGKHAIVASKPLVTQHDLSLAYSPGVAAPVPGGSPGAAGRIRSLKSSRVVDESFMTAIGS